MKDHHPQYLDLDEARALLAELNVILTRRQMKRAADVDAHGKRKLPFFLDPIEGLEPPDIVGFRILAPLGGHKTRDLAAPGSLSSLHSVLRRDGQSRRGFRNDDPAAGITASAAMGGTRARIARSVIPIRARRSMRLLARCRRPRQLEERANMRWTLGALPADALSGRGFRDAALPEYLGAQSAWANVARWRASSVRTGLADRKRVAEGR